jgi:hypothetical protein
LFGLWWFRHHFDADSDPTRMRWGFAVLGLGVASAVLYALAGAALMVALIRAHLTPVPALAAWVRS